MRLLLTEKRHPPGQDERATKSEVAGKIKRGDSVVRRFENGETAPNYRDLDDFFGAYAEATDSEIAELWAVAIKRATEWAEAEDAKKAGEAARHADEESD
jgi:hypothetical protein